ncbi:MAG: hypothetical protein IPG51_04750 [Chloroflexi bacterium]|nr:hypothetical protein [Chloroflexota bacterium]
MSALSWALVALGVAVLDWRILTAVLFLNSGAAVLCVWLFREPLWWYPATALLPAGVWPLLAQIRGSEPRHYGWSLIGAGGVVSGRGLGAAPRVICAATKRRCWR